MSRNRVHSNLGLKIDKRSTIQTLRHITANTGHLTVTTYTSLQAEVINKIKPIVKANHGFIPPCFYINTSRSLGNRGETSGFARFEIWQHPINKVSEELPWVIAVGCWEKKLSVECWKEAKSLAYQNWDMKFGWKNRLPHQPLETPWLSVVVLPKLSFVNNFNTLTLLGGCEQSIFWTLVDLDREV